MNNANKQYSSYGSNANKQYSSYSSSDSSVHTANTILAAYDFELVLPDTIWQQMMLMARLADAKSVEAGGLEILPLVECVPQVSAGNFSSNCSSVKTHWSPEQSKITWHYQEVTGGLFNPDIEDFIEEKLPADKGRWGKGAVLQWHIHPGSTTQASKEDQEVLPALAEITGIAYMLTINVSGQHTLRAAFSTKVPWGGVHTFVKSYAKLVKSEPDSLSKGFKTLFTEDFNKHVNEDRSTFRLPYTASEWQQCVYHVERLKKERPKKGTVGWRVLKSLEEKLRKLSQSKTKTKLGVIVAGTKNGGDHAGDDMGAELGEPCPVCDFNYIDTLKALDAGMCLQCSVIEHAGMLGAVS